ncbi:hypothetical protein CR513_13916, partial [Mucuna pruriens]
HCVLERIRPRVDYAIVSFNLFDKRNTTKHALITCRQNCHASIQAATKEVDFVFDKACEDAFQEFKTRLTFTPILQAPNWKYLFKLMCDASNSVLGVVLGQQVGVSKQSM